MSAARLPADAVANTPKRVLFLLDAVHRVDERLLQEWLKAERHTVPAESQIDEVSVPLDRVGELAPLRGLAEALQAPPETLVVPLRVVWAGSVDTKGVRPRLRDLLTGVPHRPSSWQARRILRKDPTRARCVAAEAATIEDLRRRFAARQGDPANQVQLAKFVAGQAALALDIAERRLRGSRYKVPRLVAENLRSSPGFKGGMEELSKSLKRPLKDLRAQADKAMQELISTPQTFWLDVMGALNRTIAGLGYEPTIVVDQKELERIRQITREHPSALLFTHKTHVDGFALYSVLFDNDFPPPHVLGGINMAFAGLGFIARRASGIFIRRTFQDDPVYKLVLRQYLGYLLEKRFPLSWAFEGTRSRVGKLMPPRYGLLKYVVEAANATDTRNLHIIPVAINYDLIGDVKDFAIEQAGKDKTPESLRWFIGYLRGLRDPMGRIYLNFGKPVVLERAPDGEDHLVLAKIAFQVGVEANRVTPLTLASLVTMILLGASPRALTSSELEAQIKLLTAWARQRNVPMTSHFKAGNRSKLVEQAEILVGKGLVTRYDEGTEPVYGIAADQHGTAGYYRNTIVHHFVVKAIAELALQQPFAADADPAGSFWNEVDRLRALFKFEFFYAPTDEFRDETRAELARYDAKWERSLEKDGSFAGRFLAELQPLVAHATLLPYVESYRVAADVLSGTPPETDLSEKDCVARSLTYGRQAYLQRRVTSQASIGKLLFQNAHKVMAHLGMVAGGGADIASRRAALSQEFRELAHRIERIRVLALPI